jgi:hypothetical protein
VSSEGAGFYQVTSRPTDGGGRQIPLKAAMPEEVRVIPPLARTLEASPDVTDDNANVHRRRLVATGSFGARHEGEMPELLPFRETAVSAVRRCFPAACLDCGVV